MTEKNHEKTSVRLFGTGIRTRDLPNASLVRYHGATSLGEKYCNLLYFKIQDVLTCVSYNGTCEYFSFVLPPSRFTLKWSNTITFVTKKTFEVDKIRPVTSLYEFLKEDEVVLFAKHFQNITEESWAWQELHELNENFLEGCTRLWGHCS